MARDERDPREIGGDRDERDPRQLSDPSDPRDQRVVPVDPRDTRAPGDERDRRLPFDVADGARRPVSLIALAVAWVVIGLGLILQPGRWSATPAYGELLRIFPQYTWGAIYLTAAILMMAAISWPMYRVVVVVAVTFGIALTASWLLAFCVRYGTNASTTVVNPAMWSLQLAILVHSATRLVVTHRR